MIKFAAQSLAKHYNAVEGRTLLLELTLPHQNSPNSLPSPIHAKWLSSIGCAGIPIKSFRLVVGALYKSPSHSQSVLSDQSGTRTLFAQAGAGRNLCLGRLPLDRP
jgi:hypothetical protein